MEEIIRLGFGHHAKARATRLTSSCDLTPSNQVSQGSSKCRKRHSCRSGEGSETGIFSTQWDMKRPNKKPHNWHQEITQRGTLTRTANKTAHFSTHPHHSVLPVQRCDELPIVRKIVSTFGLCKRITHAAPYAYRCIYLYKRPLTGSFDQLTSNMTSLNCFRGAIRQH